MNETATNLIKSYEEKGFLIIDTDLAEEVLDGARADLSRYFGENREHPDNVPYADPNRIQDGWYISKNVYEIAQSEKVLRVLSELYGQQAKPFQTLNFYTGTQQAVHADSIHFNSEPFGNMCGVWVALEDIGPDQGPLIYYPGSQNLPEMNYDYFGLEASADSYPQYLNELQKIIADKGYEPEYGTVKKGQAIIWSSNIIHGGSPQNDHSLTRHSQVTHYFIEGAKYWRPSLSQHGRSYFSPDWVRDVSGEPSPYPPAAMKRSFIRRVLGGIKRRILAR